ncbi:hypothetical protein SARC_06068 [Sphaeroforma arctica JP610]|uniref:Phosphatidate cytidylyltransferase n=1 Tax=Sphaeroforma arctica JP610 TaxID=667725 RepID=A0A0L0FXS4_9EUKA|nr:hypothetical protein SARC_06068 [Sphaeroforma arctica JP610]KNC81612.1 hypothetical protein SARC_06068 [Sphaeroforma arctica JP610]|eukprot:XP_014155514.1 hypothetical protein SARC_06068 [Sphaeroforma arctica JP610]
MGESSMRQRKAGKQAPQTAAGDVENPAKNKKLLAQQQLNDRWKSWWTRIFWSWVLVLSFVAIIYGGHLYVSLMVLGIEVACFYEINKISYKANKDREAELAKQQNKKVTRVPFVRTINWYFLFVANYFLYAKGVFTILAKPVARGETDLFRSLPLIKHNTDFLNRLASHHLFFSFLLYIVGIVVFVLTLRNGHYRRQFSQFGWTHVTVVLLGSSARAIFSNITEGLVWFLLPVFIVICNDCTAYIFGFFFGHTPLIELSPKKTWEGFLGGFISTMFIGYGFALLFGHFDYFTCPAVFSITPSVHTISCPPNPIFEWQTYPIPAELRAVIPSLPESYDTKPIALHGLVFALFGSLVAPFGGFMASGFKRAFKVKDFGDLIPGHGGFMDRFDCQFLMGSFTYVYYQSFIAPIFYFDVNTIATHLDKLSADSKLELLQVLQASIAGDKAQGQAIH